MIRIYLLYFKSVLKTNALVSIMLTILSLLLSFNETTHHSAFYIVISSYIIWIMTGGFLLSFLYFQISKKNEYYFYYNMGLSKVKLVVIAYLFHFIIISPFILILFYV
jgi:hypothetical protein